MNQDDTYKGDSLIVAYCHIKDSIGMQISNGVAIDTKASATFALSTLMAALVTPVVLGQMHTWEGFWAQWPFFLALAVGILYMGTLIVFILVARPQLLHGTASPTDTKAVIKDKEADAYIRLFQSIEKCHQQNAVVLNRKADNLELLFALAIIETVLVIAVAYVTAIIT